MPAIKQLAHIAAATLIVSALCLSASAHAASVVQMPFDDVVEQSEVAFEGRVVSRESRWNEARTSIVTHVTIEVVDTLKGTTAQRVTLTFLGGEADGMRMDVSGLRVPNPGERGVYFLESTMNQQASPIIGWNQGQFLIQQSGSQAQIYTASGRPVVGFQRVEANVQALNENEASGLQMHSGPAMSVTNFKAHVREVVRSSEERVEAAQ